MSEFKLKERTALIVGPLSRVHQSLMYQLTQAGADVVLATDQLPLAQRFASQAIEMREIKERSGRAAAIPLTQGSLTEAKDMVSRAAELFGGVDFLIDGSLPMTLRPFTEESLENLGVDSQTQLLSTIYTTQAVAPFLRARKRGRIVYLLDELSCVGLPGTSVSAALRSGLIGFAKTLAREFSDHNVTVNCVAQGITEEFLLSAFPQAGSVQASLEQLKSKLPGAVITDAERIADTVTFLVSALGAGITGSVLSARSGDHGLL